MHTKNRCPSPVTAPAGKRHGDRSAITGFTLIELLVVVTIIAILAALFVPMAAKAMSSARSTQCASNLRQIGIGINVYLSDNGDVYPPSHVSQTIAPKEWNAPLSGTYWIGEALIGRYFEATAPTGGTRIRNLKRLLVCPQDGRPPNSGGDYLPSYGLNLRICPDITNINQWNNVIGSTTISRPSETILAIDARSSRFHPGYGTVPPTYGLSKNQPNTNFTIGSPASNYNWERRHTVGANGLMADGHVAWSSSWQNDVLAGKISAIP